MVSVVRVPKPVEGDTEGRAYQIINNGSGLSDTAIEAAMEALAEQYPPTNLYRLKKSSLQVVIMGYQISPDIRLAVQLLCSLNPGLQIALNESMMGVRPDEVEVVNSLPSPVVSIPFGEVWPYAQ